MVIIQDSLHISVIFFVIRLLLEKKFLDLRQHCGGIVVVTVFLAHFSIVTFLELCLIIYLICLMFKYTMYIYICVCVCVCVCVRACVRACECMLFCCLVYLYFVYMYVACMYNCIVLMYLYQCVWLYFSYFYVVCCNWQGRTALADCQINQSINQSILNCGLESGHINEPVEFQIFSQPVYPPLHGV